MIYFYKCIRIKITERFVNPFIVFAAKFQVFKNKSKKIENYEVMGVVINKQNTTIY